MNKTIYINTWQYSQLEGNLYENFMASIIDKILKQNSVAKDKLKNVEPLLKGLANLMVKKLMNADINELFKQKSVEIEQIEQYKENFQKLIREALPDREKR